MSTTRPSGPSIAAGLFSILGLIIGVLLLAIGIQDVVRLVLRTSSVDDLFAKSTLPSLIILGSAYLLCKRSLKTFQTKRPEGASFQARPSKWHSLEMKLGSFFAVAGLLAMPMAGNDWKILLLAIIPGLMLFRDGHRKIQLETGNAFFPRLGLSDELKDIAKARKLHRQYMRDVFKARGLRILNGFEARNAVRGYYPTRPLVTLLKIRPAYRSIVKRRFPDIVEHLPAPGEDDAVTFIPWGSLEIPLQTFDPHFFVMGMTGSGKTLLLSCLMRSVLAKAGGGLRHRALVYDIKRDQYAMLRGLGVPDSDIIVVNPLDARSRPWNIAADIQTEAEVSQLASILCPEDSRETQPFFSRAAQQVLAGTIRALHEQAPGVWTLNDLLEIISNREELKQFLGRSREGRAAVSAYFATTKTSADVLSTLDTKLRPFQTVARLWASSQNQPFTLREWADPSSPPNVLLLATDLQHSAALDPLNIALFHRAAQLVVGRPEEYSADHTWCFLDEFRWAKGLEGLPQLLLLGRSKHVHVALGLADIQGLVHVYGEPLANEILGQCGNRAILRLSSPTSAQWAANSFGEYEYWAKSYSRGGGPGGPTSSTTSTLTTRRAILPQEFTLLPKADLDDGVTGYFHTPEIPPWFASVRSHVLEAHRPRPTNDPGFVPRPPTDQRPSPSYFSPQGDLQPPGVGGSPRGRRLVTLDESGPSLYDRGSMESAVEVLHPEAGIPHRPLVAITAEHTSYTKAFPVNGAAAVVADAIDPTDQGDYSWRHFGALLLAICADSAQFGAAVVTFGGGVLLVPLQVLFSAFIVILLALLLGGPKKRLMLSMIVEVTPIPALELLPGFTFNVIHIIRTARRSVKERLRTVVLSPVSGRPLAAAQLQEGGRDDLAQREASHP